MKKIKLPISNISQFNYSFESDRPEEVHVLPTGIERHRLGTIQVQEATADLDSARENGGQIIWAAISLENKMENIISGFMFGLPIHEISRQRVSFFTENILQASFCSFSAKRQLLRKIVEDENLVEGKKRDSLDRHLSRVMKYRNAFAHGQLYHDTKQGCVLEFHSGKKESWVLNDDFWCKVEAAFSDIDELLDELGQKVNGLNMSILNQWYRPR